MPIRMIGRKLITGTGSGRLISQPPTPSLKTSFTAPKAAPTLSR